MFAFRSPRIALKWKKKYFNFFFARSHRFFFEKIRRTNDQFGVALGTCIYTKPYQFRIDLFVFGPWPSMNLSLQSYTLVTVQSAI